MQAQWLSRSYRSLYRCWICLCDVMCIGRCGGDGINKTEPHIRADVRSHVMAPMVDPLDLVLFRGVRSGIAGSQNSYTQRWALSGWRKCRRGLSPGGHSAPISRPASSRNIGASCGAFFMAGFDKLNLVARSEYVTWPPREKPDGFSWHCASVRTDLSAPPVPPNSSRRETHACVFF